jgi:myo-inositol 2-dehydrogenase/D-chiro-inositol 1-dehydrogenase
MATTPEQCDRLLAAARRTGRVLTIGHELRLSTQWGRVKAIIDAGDIGEPKYALQTLFRFPYRPGAEGWRHDRARVGSWILEEPVHAFDSLMWYLERQGDPVSVLALGNGRHPEEGMEDNFTAFLRFRGGAYAVVTETLAAFEYHHLTEIIGREGSIRAWWSGTMDRTRQPAYELKVQRRGAVSPRPSPWPRPVSCSSWRRSSRKPWWRSGSGGRSSRAKRRASA